MAFNAPIMAISSLQPNSLYSINETLGLLHSINTQRDTTFGGSRTDNSTHTCNSWITLDPLHLVLLLFETLRLLLPTKSSHLTLMFQHRRSYKPIMPTAIVASQPPGHGNISFCFIISWTLLSILHGSSNTICTDLIVGVPLAGTP